MAHLAMGPATPSSYSELKSKQNSMPPHCVNIVSACCHSTALRIVKHVLQKGMPAFMRAYSVLYPLVPLHPIHPTVCCSNKFVWRQAGIVEYP